MKSFLSSVVLVLVFAVSIFAQESQVPTVDTKGLSAEQVKALNLAVEQLRKQPENTIGNLTIQNLTPSAFKEWADAGEAAGKAVANFTREIGVGADAFLKTDVGRIGLYFLIWQFGGDKVIESSINILLKLVMALVLYTFWWKLTRRFVFNERRNVKIVYNENTLFRWLGFNKKEISVEKDNEWITKWREDDQFWITFWSRVLSAVVLLLITWICWPSASF